MIKLAMIDVDKLLTSGNYRSKMLLQVHDELIFECPKGEAKKVGKLVEEVMEGAALPACDLGVPLTVDANYGANWDEAH